MDNPLETVKKNRGKDLITASTFHILNRMNFEALPLHFNAVYAGVSLNEISTHSAWGP